MREGCCRHCLPAYHHCRLRRPNGGSCTSPRRGCPGYWPGGFWAPGDCVVGAPCGGVSYLFGSYVAAPLPPVWPLAPWLPWLPWLPCPFCFFGFSGVAAGRWAAA